MAKMTINGLFEERNKIIIKMFVCAVKELRSLLTLYIIQLSSKDEHAFHVFSKIQRIF